MAQVSANSFNTFDRRFMIAEVSENQSCLTETHDSADSCPYKATSCIFHHILRNKRCAYGPLACGIDHDSFPLGNDRKIGRESGSLKLKRLCSQPRNCTCSVYQSAILNCFKWVSLSEMRNHPYSRQEHDFHDLANVTLQVLLHSSAAENAG